MNGGMIRFILGSVLKVESVLLLFPCIVAVFIENPQVLVLLTAVLSFVIGYLMVRKKPANTVFYLKEGCVTTALSWIMISLVAVCHFICQERFLHLQTRYLKRYQVLQQQAPAFCRMSNVCHRAFFSGGVSVTGLAVWACLFSFWRLSR